MRKWIHFIAGVVIGLPAWADVEPGALDREAASIFAEYKTAGEDPKLAIQRLKWSGITDEALFDTIEQDLLQNLNKKSHSWSEGNAWRVQALAYSGNPKYEQTINAAKSAKSSKVRRHAKSSAQVLALFAEVNPIIREGLNEVADRDLQYQRLANMVNSDNFELMRAGASQIYHHHFSNKQYLDLAENRIRETYKEVAVRFPDADAVGWLCKVLGKTKDKGYLPLLKEVRKNAPSKDLRRHAGNVIRDITDDGKRGYDRLM